MTSKQVIAKMLIKKFLLFSFHNPSTQTLNLCYICFRDVTP